MKLFACSLCFVLIVVSISSFAAESTDLGPRKDLVPHSLQSYVDTNHCTAPIQSSPYVIVLGNGGANMRLSCPPDRPVMYGWHFRVGYGSLTSAVQVGGGRTWITCCPFGYKWVPTT